MISSPRCGTTMSSESAEIVSVDRARMVSGIYLDLRDDESSAEGKQSRSWLAEGAGNSPEFLWTKKNPADGGRPVFGGGPPPPRGLTVTPGNLTFTTPASLAWTSLLNGLGPKCGRHEAGDQVATVDDASGTKRDGGSR